MPARHKSPPTTCPIQPSAALASAVSQRVGSARFGLWFDGHARFVPLGHEVTVVVRNEQTRDWLEHTFGAAVREAVLEICGPDTAVRWAVDPEMIREKALRAEGAEDRKQGTGDGRQDGGDSKQESNADSPAATRGTGRSAGQKDLFGEPVRDPKARRRAEETVERLSSTRPGRRWHGLADFVVGPCNRVAHAAAQCVIEEPGVGANPLVIHGPVGTGKTHLLEGIFAGLKRQANTRVCFVTAEEFTTRFVQSSRLGKMSAFRRQFRDCSALLLDNLNFLANKRGSIEEFLHTFDALLAENQQVVVTMDCHPSLADEMMPELVDRLLGGAIWSLQPPDPETRIAILRKKATTGNPTIPEGVLKLLAASLHGNVRELEGAINSLRHFAKVTGRPVDLPLAREALGELLRHSVRGVTIEEVDAAVCATLRLAQGDAASEIAGVDGDASPHVGHVPVS